MCQGRQAFVLLANGTLLKGIFMKLRIRNCLVALTAAALLAHLPSTGRAEDLLITGAGATFPFPLYSKWFSDFQKADPTTKINYQSIGSGGGIRQLQEKTVDFGASDAPMTDEQMAKSPAPVVHLPMVLGAVVITYSLPDFNSDVKISPELLSDMFLGKITNWNDPRISSLNPTLKFPNKPLLIVHRSDGSGTTAIFTDYLAKVSPEWKEKVGSGAAVKWPTGLGGKGNEGVTGIIKQTPGAIGYTELTYALANQMPVASLKNQSGEFVKPSVESVTAAAAGSVKVIPEDFRVSITNSVGKGAYPISGFTYILVFQTMKNPKAQAFKKFLDWSMGEGQKSAPSLHYSPLPKELVAKVQKRIGELKAE